MSHSAGDLNQWRRRFSTLPALALACAAFGTTGCSDELKVTNQQARIVVVGDLSEASELCPSPKGHADIGSTDAGSGDAGQDTGVVDAGPGDTGADSEDVDAEPGDAGPDSGPLDAQTGDTGIEQDAGAVDAEDGDVSPGDDAGSSDAGSSDTVSSDAVSSDAVSSDIVSSDTVNSDAVSSDTVNSDAVNSDAVNSDADASDPAPSGGVVLERDGDMVSIPYLIIDNEADAQAINVEICVWDADTPTQCGVAIAGRGGAGATGVSTTPAGQCVLHVFNWNVGCGRFVGVDGKDTTPERASVDVEDEIIARISVVDSKESPGQSAPFTLKALGFDALPHCE